MFIDEVLLELVAGTGGDGIVAYRRELKVEKGGPFGGSGGKGGDIVFVGHEGINTLLDLKYKKIIKASFGQKGRTKGMTGKDSEDSFVYVPLGTILYDMLGNVICDITKQGQKFIVCKGGRGGRGNMAFATGSNKCPDFCEKGEPGESKKIKCVLKIIADCGLVGMPSVGKSSLISAISNQRPKIASYHFTTLKPNLGMVYVDSNKSFVMADLPGIIKGASLGLGLGLLFLRHIERCRVLVHVIDISGEEGDPYTNYLIIQDELKSYNLDLLEKPQIVVCNKMDMPSSKKNLEEFVKKTNLDVIPISCLEKSNLEELKFRIYNLIESTLNNQIDSHKEEEKIYKFEKEEKVFDIKKEKDGSFNVFGDKLYRIYQMTDFNIESAQIRFARQLRSFGVDDMLKKMGAKTGDTIRVFDFEFEYID